LRVQEGSAPTIPIGLGMLATIEFNNQASLATGKVSKIRPNRNLPSKLEAAQ
jgi:hypothetical protein